MKQINDNVSYLLLVELSCTSVDTMGLKDTLTDKNYKMNLNLTHNFAL